MTRKSPHHPGGARTGPGPGARSFRPARPRPEAEAAAPVRAAERVAKVIARAGLCSRRDAEDWIKAGRVTVNGAAIGSPALNVAPSDKILVDGKPLPARERSRLFLYHKSRGLVTTNADPEGRPTIFGALPKHLPRLVTVGRLDLTTEGLLLLTNDGGLARVLELPETGWLRRYRVRAHGKVDQAQLNGLQKGIEIDGVRYGPIEATLDRQQGSNVWLTFAMREGKNREIRNVLGALGLEVNRLIRVSFGPFQLGDIPDGGIEEVKTRTLRDQLGERIAAAAGVDFTGPLSAPEAPPPPRKPAPRGAGLHPPEPGYLAVPRQADHRHGPSRRPDRHDAAPRQPAVDSSHAGRRKADRAERAASEAAAPRARRGGPITDRKGRRVIVERIGPAKARDIGSHKTSRPDGPPQSRARPHAAIRKSTAGPVRGAHRKPDPGGRADSEPAVRPSRGGSFTGHKASRNLGRHDKPSRPRSPADRGGKPDRPPAPPGRRR